MPQTLINTYRYFKFGYTQFRNIYNLFNTILLSVKHVIHLWVTACRFHGRLNSFTRRMDEKTKVKAWGYFVSSNTVCFVCSTSVQCTAAFIIYIRWEPWTRHGSVCFKSWARLIKYPAFHAFADLVRISVIGDPLVTLWPRSLGRCFGRAHGTVYVNNFVAFHLP